MYLTVKLMLQLKFVIISFKQCSLKRCIVNTLVQYSNSSLALSDLSFYFKIIQRGDFMLKTKIDIVSLMKNVSIQAADYFDSASVIAEFETPIEVLEFSEKKFNSTSEEFLQTFHKIFQDAYVTELIKQLKDQNVSFEYLS